MRHPRPYAESCRIGPIEEEDMNTNLTAAVAAEHQRQLRSDAAAFHRRDRKTGERRNRRISAFLKDLAAASL
jgi:hypothetical protein